MQAFFSPTIAAVLLIHAVFGCCWQHARQAIVAEHPGSAAASACCPHGHASSHEHSVPGKPCDCRWECHGTCVYLAEKSSLELPLLVADLHGIAMLPAMSQSAELILVGQLSNGWGSNGSGPLCAQPPLRLHLLNQILLI